MLEFSCADYTFPLLGRYEALSLLRLLDFDLVDIGLFERNPNFLPSALIASPWAFIAGVKHSLAAASLRPADVFLQIGESPAQSSANDPDPRVRQSNRDAFALAVDLCTAIQSPHLTGLPGVFHGDPAADLAHAIEEAAWRVKTAAAANIVYAIEPHLGSICATTAATHALLAQVPGLTVTLDYGHFLFAGESNAAIHTLLPHATHFHARGAAPGRLQTPAAESTIDFAHILASPYPGRFALEYVWSDWHDCNRTDNLSETILLRRHLTQIHTSLNHGDPHNV